MGECNTCYIVKTLFLVHMYIKSKLALLGVIALLPEIYMQLNIESTRKGKYNK